MNTNKLTVDDRVNVLLESLQKKRHEVDQEENKVKRGWVTNCLLMLPWRTSPLNIQSASINELVDALSYINGSTAAAAMMGLRDHRFNGFVESQWIADFQKRIAIIGIRQTRTDLVELETRVNGLISPELRREMELALIEKLINEPKGVDDAKR